MRNNANHTAIPTKWPPFSNESDSPNLSREDVMRLLTYYREEDRHECGLINHRMTWLVMFQSLGITSYAICSANPNLPLRLVLSLTLAAIGCFSAAKLGDALEQARLVIKDWHDLEGELYEIIKKMPPCPDKEYLCRLNIGRKWARGIDERHERSFAFQKELKSMLICVWVILACLAILINIIAPLFFQHSDLVNALLMKS